jgi:hypothetical protein
LQASTSAGYTALSTTLNGAATAGSTTIVLSDASGVVVGRQYQLGGSEREFGETVLVVAVSSNTVTLAQPVLKNRANGTTFKSTRVTFAIGTGVTASPLTNCFLEYTYAYGSVTQDLVIVPFDVVRYNPVSFVDSQALRRLDPQLFKRVASGLYLQGVIDNTWDSLLDKIAAKVPPGAVVGTIDLTRAHCFLVFIELLTMGANNAETRELLAFLERKFAESFTETLGRLAIDSDQDGDAVTGEKGFVVSSIKVIRC